MKSLKSVALTVLVLASIAGASIVRAENNSNPLTNEVEKFRWRCPVLWLC